MRTPSLRMRRRLHDGASGDPAGDAAFSLVEFLVAAILITIVVSGTTVTLLVSNRSGRPADNVDELERLIAQDLALIRELNDRFTCCGEECSDAAIASGAAGACGPTATVDAAFQYDDAIAAAGSLPDACLDGRVAESMIAAFPAPPTPPPAFPSPARAPPWPTPKPTVCSGPTRSPSTASP